MFRSPSSPASTIFVVLNWPHGFWTVTTKLRREFSHELLSQQIVSWARMWQLAISVPIVAVCQIWGRAQPIPYQHRPLQGWFGFLWHDFPQARFHSLLNQLFRALMLVGSKRDPTFHLSSKFLYVCMSLCLYVCVSVCPYVSMFICSNVEMPVCLYVSMFKCLYVCLSPCLYVSMSACLHVCMPACLFVCMSVCLYGSMFVCLYVCMRVCL